MHTFVRRLSTSLMVFPVFVAVVLSGCGSGGGGGGGGGGESSPPPSAILITGTAAAGAPVVGYVSVRDSSANQQPVRSHIPIEANGHYSVDVTGLTAPYSFLATGTVGGRSIMLYSAATSADEGKTINITPFTDLIIRNIAAGAVDAYVNNREFTGLTSAQLDAQRVALTNQLADALQAMGLSDSIDLLRATFNADNTGLDKFMDVVKVSTTSTTATITNIMDAAHTLVIDTATGTSTGTLGIGGLGTSGTPLDGILQTLDAFSALFASNVPSPSDPALLALFADTFMNEGENASALLTGITTTPGVKGVKFTNLVVDSVDIGAGIAQVHFTPLFPGGVTFPDKVGGAVSWQMKRVGNVWLINGNQRIAYVFVKTIASKKTCNTANPACSLATAYRTGLYLTIDDQAMKGIGAAVVTGPGLPAGGVMLEAQDVRHTSLGITTPNPLCIGCTGSYLWDMTDADIAKVLPNSVYTVKLYDHSAALLATYTEVVPASPVLNSVVSVMAYPAIGGMLNLAGRGAVTLTPSWTIPSGLRAGKIKVWMESASDLLPLEADLSTTTASSGTSTLVVTVPATGNWLNGYYGIGAYDIYAGIVLVDYK
jgi:hypothetical protein